jgi:hypothetical protein
MVELKDRSTGKSEYFTDHEIDGNRITTWDFWSPKKHHRDLKNYDIVEECFIATAAGADTIELDVLRQYRDDVLAESLLGRVFIGTYYQLSPPLAKFIEDKPIVREIVKTTLVDRLIDYARRVL